jgi:hypothetical protein
LKTINRLFIFTASLGWAISSQAIEFDDVQTILRNDCTKCHAYGKRKGGFSMETRELIFKGSENGPVIKPGKDRDSLFLHVLTTEDADERMPQKSPPLSKEKIALLTKWIKAGLPWKKDFAFRYPKAQLGPRTVKLPNSVKELNNPIDRILQPYLAAKKVATFKPVDNRTFIRRAYLDIIGLPPTPAQLQNFEQAPDRNKLVETLLANKQDYMAHWVSFWNDALRNSYTRQYHGGNKYRLTKWLQNSLLENKPYDKFVRELVNPPSGDAAAFIDGIKWRGTVNSSQVVEMQAAQNVAQVFLGINIKCASCHDSFINNWTLDQAYSFASIFANAPMEKHRCDKPTGEKSAAKFLYPEIGSIDSGAPLKQRRDQLAKLMTKPENGRFSRVMVNRLWRTFFGHGLVEPVDEMDEPPWNADLLDWLATDLANHGFNLKHTMQLITTSQAYQLPSIEPIPNQKAADFVFKGPLTRRLRAEQFLDAVSQLAKAADPEAKNRSFQRQGLRNLDRLQRVLGRPKRDQVITTRDDRPTTLQALELSNGDILNKVVQDAGNRWATKREDESTLVNDLFQNAFLRSPSDEEKDIAKELLNEKLNSNNVADLLWGIILQPEFQLLR